MKALLMILLCVLALGSAKANDSATPYIEVLGVNPHANVANSSVKIYGGETQIFFEALPTTAPWYSDNFRLIQFHSGRWIASISCRKNYNRPTTGEFRNDHMCTFEIFTKTPYLDPDSDEFDADSYKVSSQSLSSMSKTNLDILGVWPQNVKVPARSGDSEVVYSFYGKQAEVVAKRVIDKGGITMTSPSYKVSLSCKKNYIRPTNSHWMSDYMCSLGLARN